MGMYDCLISPNFETQVKCFYIPYYSNHKVWHSGGLLNGYNVGDKVPIETLYYKYSPSFLIRLYEFEDYDFAIILNEKLEGFCYYNETEKFFNNKVNVYTAYGNKLKINNYNNLVQYMQEEKEEYEKKYGDRDFIIFSEKWEEETPMIFQLGELVDCYFHKKMWAEIETDSYFINHKKDLENIKEDIVNFRLNHKDIYLQFVKENNELLPEGKILEYI